jgi:lysophospholipase L1-like esterase
MHRKSEQFIKSLGVEESKKLFLWLKPNENSNYPQGIEDDTHFNRHGAQMMAALVARGIKELKLGLSALVSTGSEPGLNTR